MAFRNVLVRMTLKVTDKLKSALTTVRAVRFAAVLGKFQGVPAALKTKLRSYAAALQTRLSSYRIRCKVVLQRCKSRLRQCRASLCAELTRLVSQRRIRSDLKAFRERLSQRRIRSDLKAFREQIQVSLAAPSSPPIEDEEESLVSRENETSLDGAPVAAIEDRSPEPAGYWTRIRQTFLSAPPVVLDVNGSPVDNENKDDSDDDILENCELVEEKDVVVDDVDRVSDVDTGTVSGTDSDDGAKTAEEPMGGVLVSYSPCCSCNYGGKNVLTRYLLSVGLLVCLTSLLAVVQKVLLVTRADVGTDRYLEVENVYGPGYFGDYCVPTGVEPRLLAPPPDYEDVDTSSWLLAPGTSGAPVGTSGRGYKRSAGGNKRKNSAHKPSALVLKRYNLVREEDAGAP